MREVWLDRSMNETYKVVRIEGDKEYPVETNLNREDAESLRDRLNDDVLASGMKLSEMRYAYRNTQ